MVMMKLIWRGLMRGWLNIAHFYIMRIIKMREWMQQGGAIPDMPDLKTELSVTEYKFSKRSRIILQPKEEIKDKTGKSPDVADALALTFARTVAPRLRLNSPEAKRGMLMCNTEYSVMEAI